MKGVLPWLVRWACRAGTRDFCSALADLVGPLNPPPPTVHNLDSFVPCIAQQAEQARLGRLSMCHWFSHCPPMLFGRHVENSRVQIWAFEEKNAKVQKDRLSPPPSPTTMAAHL